MQKIQVFSENRKVSIVPSPLRKKKSQFLLKAKIRKILLTSTQLPRSMTWFTDKKFLMLPRSLLSHTHLPPLLIYPAHSNSTCNRSLKIHIKVIKMALRLTKCHLGESPTGTRNQGQWRAASTSQRTNPWK